MVDADFGLTEGDVTLGGVGGVEELPVDGLSFLCTCWLLVVV
jgi:hypothetical protein